MRIIYIFILAFFVTLPAKADLKKTANVRLLDKVTASIKNVTIPVGESYTFHQIQVFVERCDKNPPSKTPESAAYFVIFDNSKETSEVFKGWMFSSNPSINSLEHPVYDVWLKDCK